MRKLKRMSVSLILGLVFSLPMIYQHVSASEFSFSVEPQASTFQVDKTKTYFDLKLAPSQNENLTVKLTNQTDQEIKVHIDLAQATTNSNGVVEYVSKKGQLNMSTPFELKTAVKIEQSTIKIPANKGIDYPVTVKMPAQSYRGEVAGGLTFQQIDESSSTDTSKSDGYKLAIDNEYAYVVGLILHGSSDFPAERVSLKLPKVYVGQMNAHNVIFARLNNQSPTFVNQLNVSAKIKNNKSKKIVYHSTKKNLQLAPNSLFNYPVSLKNQPLKAGRYTMEIVAKSKGRTWNLKRQFTIKAKSARQFNQKDVSLGVNLTIIWLLLALVVLITIILMVIFVLRRQLKAKEQELTALKQNTNKENSKLKR